MVSKIDIHDVFSQDFIFCWLQCPTFRTRITHGFLNGTLQGSNDFITLLFHTRCYMSNNFHVPVQSMAFDQTSLPSLGFLVVCPELVKQHYVSYTTRPWPLNVKCCSININYLMMQYRRAIHVLCHWIVTVRVRGCERVCHCLTNHIWMDVTGL